jgi:integrase
MQQSLKTQNYNIAKHNKAEIEKKLLEGRSVTPLDLTLEQFYKDYLEASKQTKSPKTWEKDKRKFKLFFDWVADKVSPTSRLKPTDIAPKHIQEFRDYKARQTSKANANSYLNILSGMFRYGIKHGYLFENPVSKVEKLKTPQKEIEFLNEKEIKALLKKAPNPWWLGVIQTGLLAGLRPAEILHLEWQDLDFKNSILSVRNKPEQGYTTKSQKVRHIPLARELKKVLLKNKKKADLDVTWVFPNSRRGPKEHNFTREFKEIAIKAKVPWATLKTLRHSFASRHAMAGRSLYKIQKWLGHQDPKTTMVYAHLMPEKDDEINL